MKWRTSLRDPSKALDVQHEHNRRELEVATLDAGPNLLAPLALEVGECLGLLPVMLHKSGKREPRRRRGHGSLGSCVLNGLEQGQRNAWVAVDALASCVFAGGATHLRGVADVGEMSRA